MPGQSWGSGNFRIEPDPVSMDSRVVRTDISAGWRAEKREREREREGGAASSLLAEISVSTRCNQRTTPIAAIPAPFRPLRQLHPRVTHWRGTLNFVSLSLVVPRPPSYSSPSRRLSFARSNGHRRSSPLASGPREADGHCTPTADLTAKPTSAPSELFHPLFHPDVPFALLQLPRTGDSR